MTHLRFGECASSRDERARQETFDAVRAYEALEIGREAERHRLAMDEFRLARNDGYMSY